jgi:hypothetical protein
MADPRQLDTMTPSKIVAALPGARRAVRLRKILFGESFPQGETPERQGGVIWH